MVRARKDLDVVFTQRRNGTEELVVDRVVYGARTNQEAINAAGWSEGQIDDDVICVGVNVRWTQYGHAVRQRFRSVRHGGGFRRDRDGRYRRPSAARGEMGYSAVSHGALSYSAVRS